MGFAEPPTAARTVSWVVGQTALHRSLGWAETRLRCQICECPDRLREGHQVQYRVERG